MEYKLMGKKIVIYGAASYGKRVYEIFERNGYPVTAFIDKRADEIKEFLGKKVFLPEEFFENAENNKVVIFIAIKNVFEHSKIAQLFMKRGMKRIIFRSRAVLMGSGDGTQIRLNNVYTYVDEDKFEMINVIPEILNDDASKFEDRMLICEDETGVVVNIPWQFVFTDKKETHSSEWMNINIGTMYPHLSFFRYLLGINGSDGCKEYLQFCVDAAKKQGDIEITKQWKKNVIQNRKIVFQQMNLSYELDKGFFVRNAPKAVWNSKEGHFNLKSGKHRAAFQLAKGNKFIPLKITAEDYGQFRNDSIAEMVHSLVGGERRILHPMLFDPMFGEWDFWDQIEKVILHYLSRESYTEKHALSTEGKSILVGLHRDDGSVPRNFAILGFKVSCIINNNVEEIELINSLHNKKDQIRMESDLKKVLDEKYDYIILDVQTLKKYELDLNDIEYTNFDKFFLMSPKKENLGSHSEMECIYNGLLGVDEENLYVISKKK